MRILTSAASDARMSGVNLPAISSAGSGNHGINVQPTDGIITSTSEQTMKNMGEISREGMLETDRTIQRIMIAKQFEVRVPALS